MKYEKTVGGYFYKIYSNGDKKRISKEVFDKNVMKGGSHTNVANPSAANPSAANPSLDNIRQQFVEGDVRYFGENIRKSRVKKYKNMNNELIIGLYKYKILRDEIKVLLSNIKESINKNIGKNESNITIKSIYKSLDKLLYSIKENKKKNNNLNITKNDIDILYDKIETKINSISIHNKLSNFFSKMPNIIENCKQCLRELTILNL
jgi:hypothetical protein